MPFRFPRLCRLLAALLALSAAASPSAAAPALAVGETVEAQGLKAGESRLLALAAGEGDYLRVRLAVAGGRFRLDLQAAEGSHVRRLAEGLSGTATVRFIAPQAGALRVTALEAGTFRLTLERRVPPGEQAPPPRRLESPAIAALAETLSAGGGTEAFWASVAASGAPLVEDGPEGRKIVTFLGRGAKRNIRLFGAPTGDHEELERLGASDVWFRSFAVPADTRLSYRLAPDVPDLPEDARERRVAILATAAADPLNRHPWPADAPDDFNRESVLELPDAPPQPFVAERGAPKGTLTRFPLSSERLGNTREIALYRPPGFDPADPDTVLLFVFDAAEYLGRVPVPLILDNMIAAGVVPPVAAVFVANPDGAARTRELPANPAFADFMALELLPRVLTETGLAARPRRTALAGSSFGGLAAATVALAHPQAFGNVLSMSGSFWWSPPGAPEAERNHVAATVARAPQAPPLRFFLSAGLFETARGGSGGILDASRHLRDVLLARGAEVHYREYAGGHDYLVWRGTVSDGLIALFGRQP